MVNKIDQYNLQTLAKVCNEILYFWHISSNKSNLRWWTIKDTGKHEQKNYLHDTLLRKEGVAF